MLKDPYEESHFTRGFDWNNNRTSWRRNNNLENCTKIYIEGWGAAVAVGVTAAASVASSAISASAQADAAGIAPPKLKSYTPVLAQQDQYAGIRSLNNAIQSYGTQAQQNATQENRWYQQSIDAIAPGAINAIGQASKQAGKFLKGEIPADVQASIQRATAQNALTGGFGADSGMGRNLVARDFGLTSLDLQQRGLSQLNNVTALSRSLNPFSAGDILGSAASYQANRDRYELTNTDRQNTAAQNAAGIQNQNAQNQYQSEVNQALAPNPYVAGALAAASSVGNAALSYYGRGSVGGASGATPASPGYTAAASSSGYYNPYLDQGNYGAAGNFYGNPYSYG